MMSSQYDARAGIKKKAKGVGLLLPAPLGSKNASVLAPLAILGNKEKVQI